MKFPKYLIVNNKILILKNFDELVKSLIYIHYSLRGKSAHLSTISVKLRGSVQIGFNTAFQNCLR